MTQKPDQLQRAFEKLTQACPREWTIAKQEVIIEDFATENDELRKRAKTDESKVKEPEAAAANQSAAGDQ